MATHSFQITDVTMFPEGTSIGLYPLANFTTPDKQLYPSGAPPGSASTTATMTSGVTSFTGVTDGEYWAVAQVGGVYRYKRVSVGPFTGGAGDYAHTGADNAFTGANSFSQNVTIGPYITATASTGGLTNTAWTLDGNGGLLLNGNITMNSVGKGLLVKEGANATMGTATLVAGTVVVSTTKVTANSRIFLTNQSLGGTAGFLRVSARTAGTSFTILSSSGTDTSAVAWMIVEPA